jgi:hypothetical protein
MATFGDGMSFEDNHDDYWSGRGDSSHSKANFLKAAVENGAVQTGFSYGHEYPYYGAHNHAEELVREGLIKKWDGPYRAQVLLVEESIWIPTDAGKENSEREK